MADRAAKHLQLAASIARANAERGGTPFGAVIVRADEIVATGVNQVRLHQDLTAHAEITAIRAACRARRTRTLDDCELYSSAEPCPMCFEAAIVARIAAVYYGATQQDVTANGFQNFNPRHDLAPAARDVPRHFVATPQAVEALRIGRIES